MRSGQNQWHSTLGHLWLYIIHFPKFIWGFVCQPIPTHCRGQAAEKRKAQAKLEPKKKAKAKAKSPAAPAPPAPPSVMPDEWPEDDDEHPLDGDEVDGEDWTDGDESWVVSNMWNVKPILQWIWTPDPLAVFEAMDGVHCTGRVPWSSRENVGKRSSHWGDGSRNSEPHSLSDQALKKWNWTRLVFIACSGQSFEVTAVQVNTLTLFAVCGTMLVGSKIQWCAMKNNVYLFWHGLSMPQSVMAPNTDPILPISFVFVGVKHLVKNHKKGWYWGVLHDTMDEHACKVLPHMVASV